MAHSLLGTSYRDLRNLALGNQHLQHSYELRDRVSERERLEITATYYRYITGELDKRVETTALLTRTYPQDPYGHHIHGNSLMIAGQFEQAAESYRTALRIDPNYSLPRANLALALIAMNRFAEAHQIIQQGIDQGSDFSGFHTRLYLLGFIERDFALMERQVQWFTGRPEEYQIREFQARSLAAEGKSDEAKKSLDQAAMLAEARGLRAEKLRILGNEASLNETFGMKDVAEKQLTSLVTLLQKQGIGPEELQTSLIQQLDSQPLAWTFALCGDERRAESLETDFQKKFPLDTMNNSIWGPLVRATIELRRAPGPAAAGRAIQMLPPTFDYEGALDFKPTSLRAQAYLQAGNGQLAAAQFQKIIDHRGWDVLSPLWPLAHLGLARAAVLDGDIPKARKAYEDFFALWKDADANLPVLIDARRAYTKLAK